MALLAWWSFNNSNNDSDLLNATGDDNARPNFGHLIDNNDPFDDGFYDPATDRLFPVSDGAPGALVTPADPGPGIPDVADYRAYLDVTGLTGDNFDTGTANNWGSFGGTGLNRPDGSFAGGSLSVTGTGNNGAWFDIRADLTGFTDIDISWANRGTSTGFDSRTVSVSTDGGTNFTTIYTDSGDLTSSFAVETADALALLDNASDAVIRFGLAGATSTSGNNRFDNIQLTGTAATLLVINEVLGSTPGVDAEFVEMVGAPGETLDGYSLIVVETDTGSTTGRIDKRIDFDAGDTFGAQGYFLTGHTDRVMELFGVAVDKDLPANFIENSSYTLALVETAGLGSVGDTVSGAEGVIDAVAVLDNDADAANVVFGASVVGPVNNNEADGAARTPEITGPFVAQLTDDATPVPGAGTTPPPPPPTGTTLISAVQGAGDASPLAGQTVTIEGIVVGDYDDLNELGGFYIQEEDTDADADAATSEGVFVFTGGAFPVAEGDKVSVTGVVEERFGQTQLGSVSALTVQETGQLAEVTPALLDLSADYEAEASYESTEGMLVTLADTVVVSEYFQLGRFGQVVLTEGERAFQFTQDNAPDVAGFAAHQAALVASQIILDDTNNVNNFYGPGDDTTPIPFPEGGLSETNFFRGGDSLSDLTGVLSWTWAGSGGTDAWRLRPTEEFGVTIAQENPRPSTPEDVGGTLKVASFNVLNYFSTIDDGVATINGLEPRGADSQAELDRQTDKLVTALVDMDADIVGLVEIENEFADTNGDGRFALSYLVDALNTVEGANTWAYLDPGRAAVDTSDAISTAMIYKTATVAQTPGTTVSILDDAELDRLVANGLVDPSVDPGHALFDGASSNRASLAASFTEIATGESVTISTHHFKSKGSVSPFGDNADAGDGAGNNNEARLQAAQAVEAWLASDPTGVGHDRSLILGDLNAYAQEDPLTFLADQGYADLAQRFVGEDAYSYLFDSQLGTLDYALSSTFLTPLVTGATEWHINADEIPLFDYNDAVRDASESSFEEESAAASPFTVDAFRTSDHDPVIVGLQLAANLVSENGFGKSKGTDQIDRFVSGAGRNDRMVSTEDNRPDTFVFGAETLNGQADRDLIRRFEIDLDFIELVDGAEIAEVLKVRNALLVVFEGDGDLLTIKGRRLDPDDLMILDAPAQMDLI